MTMFLVLKAASALVSIALAAGLLARDHGLKANRLIAAFLLCNGYWALLEFFLYRTDDPVVATWIYRAMTLGWMPLGVLCAHASVSLSAMEDHPGSKWLPACYVGVALVLPLSISTDWVIEGAEAISLGWRAVFGPGMILAYALLAAPVIVVLSSWRELLAHEEGGGRLAVARIVFFGISAALTAGTLTAILLPVVKVESVGITTSLVALVGASVAITLRRYGHSLIAPDAFAREILDTLEDGVILVGEDGRLRDANRAFFRMAGEPESAVIGRPVADFLERLPDLSPDAEGSRLGELTTSTGASMPIVLSAPVEWRGKGGLAGRAYLLRDRREIVSLQRQLIVSARLAAVGDLSKSISRSIQQPIARVQSEFEGLSLDWASVGDLLEFASLDAECREALDEGHELIEECVEGTERIFSVVREVAGFSGDPERQEFSPFALDRIVERSVRIAQVQAPPGLEIEARLDPNVAILCHHTEIERVVTNLLVNSIHALDGNPVDRRHLVVAVAAQGDRALLHVEDDGCGIEADVLDRIFDPFFTTKPVGKGTGLGLAISYHVVRAHGGEIRVSSVPGRGTSVAVELPRTMLEENG